MKKTILAVALLASINAFAQSTTNSTGSTGSSSSTSGTTSSNSNGQTGGTFDIYKSVPAAAASRIPAISAISGVKPVAMPEQIGPNDKVEYAFEEKLVTCSEINSYRISTNAGTWVNPHNRPGSKQRVQSWNGEYNPNAEVIAIGDPDGWYSTKIAGVRGNVLGFGGAVMQRGVVYKNGEVFQKPGDWTPNKIGPCANTIPVLHPRNPDGTRIDGTTQHNQGTNSTSIFN